MLTAVNNNEKEFCNANKLSCEAKKFYLCHSAEIHGHCDEEFEDVRKAFKKNFKCCWEAEGASFAVYYKGKLVVDIWGGYADKSCLRPWSEDTLSLAFSTTKSVTAICIAILIDRGFLDYDDPISKHWPEFGKNGKQHITVQMVLSHRAGLIHFEEPVSMEHLTDRSKMSTLIENMRPVHEPDVKTAYHVVTYGWIMDHLCERVDPLNRSIAEFVQQEICEKHNIEFHIGLPTDQIYRMARLKRYGCCEAVCETIYSPMMMVIGAFFLSPIGFFSQIKKDMRCAGKDFTMFNNPALTQLEMPAANGVATARDLAKIHHLLVDLNLPKDQQTPEKLLSSELINQISEPLYPSEFDHVIGDWHSKGHGFMYTKSPMGTWQLGHLGVGGQNVKTDFQNELTFAYLTNGMKASVGEHVRTFMRLQNAVYRSLKKIQAQQKS